MTSIELLTLKHGNMKDILNKVLNRGVSIINHLKGLSGYYNLHYRQKKWTKVAIKMNLGNEVSWGEPTIENEMLGDYIKIKDHLLLPNIKGKTVVELGCLDGKWSQHIVPYAGFTHLVDLSKTILPVLKKRLSNSGGGGGVGLYSFYETKGYELDGIRDNSIDFIFSIDTLVRVNKKYLRSYFNHFRRVLKSDGKMLIHLPCNVVPFSRQKGFVNLSPSEIVKMLHSNDFEEFGFDFSTINHGVLIKYNFN